MQSEDRNGTPIRIELSAALVPSARPLRLVRWLPGVVAGLLWIGVVYELPLLSLRDARQISRAQLANLVHTGKPDAAAILDAFDRATENVLFAASGPYLILAITSLFVIAHLVGVKRRLDAAERNIQVLRDIALGVDGISLKSP